MLRVRILPPPIWTKRRNRIVRIVLDASIRGARGCHTGGGPFLVLVRTGRPRRLQISGCTEAGRRGYIGLRPARQHKDPRRGRSIPRYAIEPPTWGSRHLVEVYSRNLPGVCPTARTNVIPALSPDNWTWSRRFRCADTRTKDSLPLADLRRYGTGPLIFPPMVTSSQQSRQFRCVPRLAELIGSHFRL